MLRYGILLIVLGLGSLVLPMFNLQFRLLQLLDDYQPIAGIVIAAIGAVMVFMSMRNRPAAAPAAENTTPPSA